MVHVSVRQADVVDGDDLAGSPSYVEAYVVFRRSDYGLLATKREAEDRGPGEFFAQQSAHSEFI